MIVDIESTSRLPRRAYDRTPSRQRHWWLLRTGAGFVRIPSVAGLYHLELTLDLEPGECVMGVGTREHGIRERFTVPSPGSAGSAEESGR